MADDSPIPREDFAELIQKPVFREGRWGMTADLERGTPSARPVTAAPPMATGGRSKTPRRKSMGGDIVSGLLLLRNQIKLYHWQTRSFSRHKATDDLTATLDEKIDSFVEVYMGKYGRPHVSGSFKLHNFSEAAAKAFVEDQRKFLTGTLPSKLSKTDSDLLNIRDEILGELNKVLYLFSLA